MDAKRKDITEATWKRRWSRLDPKLLRGLPVAVRRSSLPEHL